MKCAAIISILAVAVKSQYASSFDNLLKGLEQSSTTNYNGTPGVNPKLPSATTRQGLVPKQIIPKLSGGCNKPCSVELKVPCSQDTIEVKDVQVLPMACGNSTSMVTSIPPPLPPTTPPPPPPPAPPVNVLSQEEIYQKLMKLSVIEKVFSMDMSSLPAAPLSQPSQQTQSQSMSQSVSQSQLLSQTPSTTSSQQDDTIIEDDWTVYYDYVQPN